MCSSLSWIINKSKFAKRFNRVIDDTDISSLSEHNKLLLRERYVTMVNTSISESIRSSAYYFILQTTTTVGSILVPALLSAEESNLFFNSTASDEVEYTHHIYWSIWGVSLAVTLCNAITQLTSMDKKYMMRKINVSLMKKEGWLFLQKSGVIYGKYKHKLHNDIISLFWDRVEKLRFDQVISDLSYDYVSDEPTGYFDNATYI